MKFIQIYILYFFLLGIMGMTYSMPVPRSSGEEYVEGLFKKHGMKESKATGNNNASNSSGNASNSSGNASNNIQR